jgi:endonuclease/exonuclease/phosphatase family metal-dependent hydrolase
MLTGSSAIAYVSIPARARFGLTKKGLQDAGRNVHSNQPSFTSAGAPYADSDRLACMFLNRFFANRAAVLTVTLLLIVKLAVPGFGTERTEPVIYSGSAAAAENVNSTGLKVVSLNMAREERLDSILRDLQRAQSLTGTDVWLLQEAAERPALFHTIAGLADSLKLNYVYVPVDFLDSGQLASGLAILSRFPILEPRVISLPKHDLKFHTRRRIALQAKIAGPAGPVYFFNVHLDTRITLQQRIEQIMPVIEAAESLDAPAIVGGDFNTADVRWFWNVFPVPYAENHSGRLRHEFRKRGFTSPLDGNRGTIDLPGIPLHLDWIFPRGLQPVASGVTSIKFSDHNAVWVRFDRQAVSN